MKKNFVQRGIIYLKDWQNPLLFSLVNFLQPIYRRLFPSDVAYLYCDHPVITPFVIRLHTKLGIRVHILKPQESFTSYRKVIVPNGMWPEIRSSVERIPTSKRVYCEVGFFPQNRNIYFDGKGVHGHSSVRDARLDRLTPDQKSGLEAFKDYYTRRNFIKHRWSTVDDQDTGHEDTNPDYESPFLFVPLQLESDTAFDLCPFDSNQEMIDAIELALPDKRIIYKVHPWDTKSAYRVSDRNLLLPYTNTDLKQLILLADAVVNCNSTVMLEALLYDKKCASLGIGFSTNHNVSLECQEDINLLKSLDDWQPDPDRVDSFLFLLLSKQVSIKFWNDENEMQKLAHWMSHYEIT